MKRLFLVRHAKSSWKDMNLDDFDRPLSKRGKENAPLMGKRLKKRGVVPDLILSSSALRAKATAKKIAKKLGCEDKVVLDDSLYDSDSDTMLKLLQSLDEKISVVFLVGHNPELNILADELVGFDENIVTAGIVEIVFSCKKWKQISAKNAECISFDFPKKLFQLDLEKMTKDIQ